MIDICRYIKILVEMTDMSLSENIGRNDSRICRWYW